jgi:tetratricopeptide (TPR) repeat protein
LVIKDEKSVYQELDKLIRKIQKNQVVFFVGSAISYAPPSNLPSWQFLKETILKSCTYKNRILAKHVKKILSLNPSMEISLQYLADVTLDSDFDLTDILDVYNNGLPNLNHAYLAQAAKSGYFDTILTTNFDELIEISLANLHTKYKSYYDERGIKKIDYDETAKKILKFHGTIGKKKSIQASIRQVGTGLPIGKKASLEFYLKNYNLVFVGYSANDPDIETVLKNAKRKHAYWIYRSNPDSIVVKENITALKIDLNKLFEYLWDNTFDLSKQYSQSISSNIKGISKIHRVQFIAEMQNHLGLKKEAFSLWDKNLSYNEPKKYPISHARILCSMAEYKLRSGELSEGKNLIHQSLDLSKKSDDDTGIATCLKYLGMISIYTGELEEAVKLMEDCIEATKKIHKLTNKYFLRSGALENLGNIYLVTGNFKKAIKYFSEALLAKQKAGDTEGLALTYSNLASVYEDENRIEEALDSCREAEKINSIYKNKDYESLINERYAQIYEKRNDYDKALHYHKLCLELNTQMNDLNGVVKSYGNIGHIYSLLDDYGNAKKYNELALSKITKMPESPETMHDERGCQFKCVTEI